MKNEALAKAQHSLEIAIRELRANSEETQVMYHALFVNMLGIQKNLRDALQSIREVEPPDQ